MRTSAEAQPTLGNTFRLHGYEHSMANADQLRRSVKIIIGGMLCIAAVALAQPAPSQADESLSSSEAISKQVRSREEINALITIVGSAMVAAAGIWVSSRNTASAQ